MKRWKHAAMDTLPRDRKRLSTLLEPRHLWDLRLRMFSPPITARDHYQIFASLASRPLWIRLFGDLPTCLRRSVALPESEADSPKAPSTAPRPPTLSPTSCDRRRKGRSSLRMRHRPTQVPLNNQVFTAYLSRASHNDLLRKGMPIDQPEITLESLPFEMSLVHNHGSKALWCQTTGKAGRR